MEGTTMPVIRTYQCNTCGEYFEVTCGADDPDPPCKYCEIVMEWRPKSFSIGGSMTSKCVDYTQQVLEQDYGETNFNDSQREGDIAHKATPRPRAEQEVLAKLEHDAKEYAAQKPSKAPAFWGGEEGAPVNLISQAMAGAKEQAALARAEGNDPIVRAQKGERESGGMPFRPLARG